jgi:hypothetical protein
MIWANDTLLRDRVRAFLLQVRVSACMLAYFRQAATGLVPNTRASIAKSVFPI